MQPLITEFFPEDDKHLDGDAVFGVRRRPRAAVRQGDRPRRAAGQPRRARHAAVAGLGHAARPDLAAGLMPLVRVRDVSKVFANGVQALDGASLDIEAGEFLSVLGPSGCGKSTLLRLIAGLAEPTAGTIDWPQGKPDLGFVFQEPTLDAVDDGAGQRGAAAQAARAWHASEREARAAEALAGVGLEGLREQLSARTVGRHEDARLDRAGAGHRARSCC